MRPRRDQGLVMGAALVREQAEYASMSLCLSSRRPSYPTEQMEATLTGVRLKNIRPSSNLLGTENTKGHKPATLETIQDLGVYICPVLGGPPK